jgi:hypothetical protein
VLEKEKKYITDFMSCMLKVLKAREEKKETRRRKGGETEEWSRRDGVMRPCKYFDCDGTRFPH